MTTQTVETQDSGTPDAMKELIDQYSAQLPKAGDLVTGKVLSSSKNEVILDINGIASGIVRGFELIDESGEYSHLKVGDEVTATVIDIENELGILELSFRAAGHKKAWDSLVGLMKSGEIVSIRVTDANKGGLMVTCGNVAGFMPVSQLCPEHYPRIQGGDKNKILERLRQYIGQSFDAKVIDVDETEEKLIVSEKAAWEEQQQDIISSYKVGDVVEGVVTVITDFGAFVQFGNSLEGLVHISELAWQRIDDPRDVVRPGQKIKAEIIKIEKSKIFLSMKKLIEDPWKRVGDRYKVGEPVQGKVLKVNPFGLFVELDPEIHGLAHVSELSTKPVDPTEIAKPGAVMTFQVISIEPNEHRLGLSLKALGKKKAQVTEGETSESTTSSSAPEASPVEVSASAATEETPTEDQVLVKE